MARSKGDTIRSAAILDGKIFDSLLAHLIHEETIVDWDKKAGRFVAERRRSIGALVIDSDKLTHVPVEAKRRVLLEQVRDTHLDVLPWTKELRQWQARVQLLRSVTGDASWPDVSNEGLLLNLSDWLGPYLDPISKLSDFRQLDLLKILHARLPWPLPQQLAELAPVRLEVPSGSMIAIDYNRSPPVLAVKLQEMFGSSETPSIAEGKVKLLLHLLSPAGRPLQITGDLAGFWLSSYAEVKKEMKGRYPKHPWPDDPLLALPTRRTRQRS
jgi:ATP-dependent helicase HrpB